MSVFVNQNMFDLYSVASVLCPKFGSKCQAMCSVSGKARNTLLLLELDHIPPRFLATGTGMQFVIGSAFHNLLPPFPSCVKNSQQK